MHTGRVRRVVAALAIATMLPVTAGGCFGRFQLTRIVYGINSEVSNERFVRWFVFLAFSIIPVYGAMMVGDALIVNSIEFWTGRNPVRAREARFAYGPNGEVARTELLSDGRLALSVSAPGAETQELWLVREPDALAAYDAAGNLVARVGDVDGRPALLPAR